MNQTKETKSKKNNDVIEVDDKKGNENVKDTGSGTEIQEIRMDEKITLTSIAPWNTGFARILTIGDVTIAPHGMVRLSRDEVLAQGQSGNKLITGIDGMGSHATIYIEDEWTRRELGFDTDEKKQTVVNKEFVKEMFNKKTFDDFKESVINNITTRAEKFNLLSMINILKINDYDKIAFCEKFCGSKLNAAQ